MGDCKPLRDGVQELRIDHGPGYRVYLSRQGVMPVLLLCGSDKGNQRREIANAIAYLNDWKERGQTMNTPRDTSYTDSLREALKDPEEAAAYIEAAIEQGDNAALLVALRHVAAAHGMAEVTRSAGTGEKTLFKTLSETGNPTLDTFTRVLRAVGLRLSVTPAEQA